MTRPDVFVDISALILSAVGGARVLFALGEARAIQLWCSQDVLGELDSVLRKKNSDQLPLMSAWLAQVRFELVQPPSKRSVRRLQRLVRHSKDAVVLAAAMDADMDYFVTLDSKLMFSADLLRALPFPLGPPANCLEWFRELGSVA